jgi:hypothetical protein
MWCLGGVGQGLEVAGDDGGSKFQVTTLVGPNLLVPSGLITKCTGAGVTLLPFTTTAYHLRWCTRQAGASLSIEPRRGGPRSPSCGQLSGHGHLSAHYINRRRLAWVCQPLYYTPHSGRLWQCSRPDQRKNVGRSSLRSGTMPVLPLIVRASLESPRQVAITHGDRCLRYRTMCHPELHAPRKLIAYTICRFLEPDSLSVLWDMPRTCRRYGKLQAIRI